MKIENDLGRDDIKKLVLRIAIPYMLAQFVNVLYSIVDRMFIGNIPVIGEQALAGAGICGPIVTLITSFATLVGIGGAPLLSIRLGAKDEKGARQILANCFIMLLVLSILIPILVLTTKSGLLRAFGASDVTYPYADEYMTVYVMGAVFALISAGMNQFLICQGYAKRGMISVMIGAVTNIVLDPVFIFVFNMGVAGAAIATVISQAVSSAYILYYLFSPKVPIRITFGGYRIRVMKRILMYGLSPFIIIAFDSLLIIGMNVTLKLYGGSEGDMYITCATIMQSFFLMITMPLGGITGGTQSILGYNFGAGNVERIRQALRVIAALCLLFNGIMMVAAFTASPFFVRLFTSNEEYAELSVWAIKMSVLGLIPLALQYSFVDAFTGMGLPTSALPLSFMRKFNYFLLLFLLPMIWGARTIFYVEPIVDVIAGIITTIVFLSKINKILNKRKLEAEAEAQLEEDSKKMQKIQ